MTDQFKSEKVITVTKGVRTVVNKVNDAVVPRGYETKPVTDKKTERVARVRTQVFSGAGVGITSQATGGGDCCAEHIQDTSNPHSVNAIQVGATVAQWNASKLQDYSISTTNPTSGQHLVFDGSQWAPADYTPLTIPVVSKNSNYTLTDDDYVVLVTAGSNLTMTLPSAGGREGKVFVVKKIDSSYFEVIVAATGGQTIDDASTKTLNVPMASFTLFSNGSNWYLV